MRQDYWDSAANQFGAAGMRRILSKGAHFPDCRHLASTFSASTLATLATGAWPAQHGIVADSWYDRAAHGTVPASREALVATTLTAQVAGALAGDTRTYAIGMTATQASLFAGSSKAQQFWMDRRGRFTTLGEPPAWLGEFNLQKPLENAHDAAWMAVGARPGAPPLRTLTYDPEHPEKFLDLYQASPLGQAAQFELLVRLIEKQGLGQGDTFDFVCLVADSTARLGYEVGGRSPLMRQMVLHLDQQLEYLLTQLKGGPGENGFNLVLAGGHGAPPDPAEESRGRMAVPGESVAQTVDRVLIASGAGRVTRYVYPYLYLDTNGFRDPEPLRMAAGRAALQHPAVAGFYTAGGYCSTNDSWRERFRNSFHHSRSGDVMLSYLPEYVEDFGQGRGVSYGSLYNYDVRVPLCFYGPQFTAGVFESPVHSVDLAPTLARVMGVATPSSSDGRVLAEALVE